MKKSKHDFTTLTLGFKPSFRKKNWTLVLLMVLLLFCLVPIYLFYSMQRVCVNSNKMASNKDCLLEREIIKKNPHELSNSNQSLFGNSAAFIIKQSLLPQTSIWCFGQGKRNRICKFKNLYYDPSRQVFFAVIGERSVKENVPTTTTNHALLDGTSLDDHGSFYLDFEQVPTDKFSNVQVSNVQLPSFIFKRFHVGNIMHTIHDDLLGLYYNIKKFSPQSSNENLPPFASFDLNHFVFLVEGHKPYEYGKLFDLFSNFPAKFSKDLNQDTRVITRFSEGILGQSKALNWYQYGFRGPQGPIAGKVVDGTLVRDAANFMRFRLGVSLPSDMGFNSSSSSSSHTQSAAPNKIVLFSRTKNRLILNERTLLTQLAQQFSLQPHVIRMEEMSLKEQIEILVHTKVAIGMHGSILIMAMFMPKGSILIELYPYAVPSNNYTPYKTLCKLNGVDLVYRAWENKHHSDTLEHPDRNMLQGGINHLPLKQRQAILSSNTVPPHKCCTDPYWLFRIYQDTRVNIDEVSSLISDAMIESDKLLESVHKNHQFNIQPSVIDDKTISCSVLYTSNGVEGILLKWEAPWNGVEPDFYEVWEHVSYQKYESKATSIVLKNQKFVDGVEISYWIRTVKDGTIGRYSKKKKCKITLPKK